MTFAPRVGALTAACEPAGPEQEGGAQDPLEGPDDCGCNRWCSSGDHKAACKATATATPTQKMVSLVGSLSKDKRSQGFTILTNFWRVQASHEGKCTGRTGAVGTRRRAILPLEDLPSGLKAHSAVACLPTSPSSLLPHRGNSQVAVVSMRRSMRRIM
jgi:hypothetical protein